MRCHLEVRHPDEFSHLQAKEKDQKSASSSSSLCDRPSDQLTVTECLMKSQPLAFDSPRAKEITRRIGEMIALDNEPFNVVNHTGFTRLMKLV